jgi:hypothetical protein
MMSFKWAGILVGTLAAALAAMANVLVASLTEYSVPGVVNDFAIAVAATGLAVGFTAHACAQLNTRLELTVELLVRRLEEVEDRVGDRNTGFVEGYLIGHGNEATVIPLVPNGGRRGAGG